MKHPTKEAFIAALRHAVRQLEDELVIPEDPDEIEGVDEHGVLPPLAAWMLREVYRWGYHAGEVAGSGRKLERHEHVMVAPKPLTQGELFGDDEDDDDDDGHGRGA